MPTDIFKARGCWCDQLRAVGGGDAQCSFCSRAEIATLRAEIARLTKPPTPLTDAEVDAFLEEH